MVSGTYCAESGGVVFPRVVAKGREGLWCLLHFEYRVSSEVAQKVVEDEDCNLQAEEEGFFWVKLEIGL